MTRQAARSPRHTPAVEPLEGRRLLSQFYAGPSATRPVQSAGGVYTLAVSGGGFEKVKQVGHGSVAVSLFGTTPTSVLNVTLTRPRLHVAAASLSIASIRVASGQLGGVRAGSATLLGAVTPLNGSVNSLEFGSLGPDARIDVNGSVGSLSLGAADLGPGGHVRINGDLTQSLNAGSLALNGGQFVVSHDLSGSLSVGSLNVSQGGQFLVGHNLAGSANVSGNLALDTNGVLAVGNDLTGTLTVTGDLTLAGGARLSVGRLLNALVVNGNLTVAPSGGSIAVGGDLTTLKVTGAFAGQGSATAADLSVGLTLGGLTVLGGGAGRGGIQNANIDVTKNIQGLDVPHGIFNSLITAGVLIDGGTAPSGGTGNTGGNVGPDGADAIVNSEIRAGVQIKNVTINGNVRSTFAVNPHSAGYRTRIVAGEDREGNYTSGGNIDNFQITGALIDSVLAASVAPAGGNGTLPRFAYGTPPPSVGTASGDLGHDTYDAPAGIIDGGTVGDPIPFLNFSEVSYSNETPIGVAYDRTKDPTIDDAILPGAINPSFASPPLSKTALTSSQDVTTTTGGSQTSVVVTPSVQVLPLPTRATVLGGVISTVHGDEADFAGIFAADTRGVFIGNLPQ